MSKSESQNEPDSHDRFNGHLVVGLGASAGGLEALEEFFDELPSDPGMSFVVITHQAPGAVSLLPELIARHCKMPITKVDGATKLEPNNVYVQPPGVTLGLLRGELHPFEPTADGPRPLAIDFFFRSLAQDQKSNAVGIVLSGTGTDGTNGLREIHAVSGLVMAQSEASARYGGMPHSANAALSLDFVLTPREMARQLLVYRDGAAHALGQVDEQAGPGDVMRRLFVLLRSRTGHDFSNYKESTIARRIVRRMALHRLATTKDYVKFVRANPQELDQLFKELLIGVTSFFRDPEGFDALLGRALPRAIAEKPSDYVMRGWIAGCSTGEEAYTIAILLREYMESANAHVGVQLFATDLDPEAIDFARPGIYPEAITTDVSPKRLERYFTHQDRHYRVKKEIREMVVFAIQDLTEDPAFTKLDLLVCRNLLIYLNSDLQKRLLPLFHYALKPGGILMLGSSETIGQFSHLFDVLDKKWKIFQRREVPAGTYVADVALGYSDVGLRETRPGVIARRRIELNASQIAERALLQHLVPPSLIMHESGEIVHVQGRTGMFLEPAPGAQAGANVYNMAREGLELELTLAVRKAATSADDVVQRGIRVKTNGAFTCVDLRVKKLSQPDALKDLYLVAFERIRTDDVAPRDDDAEDGTTRDRVGDLERELAKSREFHQSMVEDLETANQELKIANEELQSMNEELQSSNEEHQTSKEELQSLNEELQTVNFELQGKIDELSRSNDDMTNLLNATDIGTLFLDNQLRIVRFTARVKRLVRLISSDVGRPLEDLVSNLRHANLAEHAREVLRTLVFKETEVQSEDGAWYLMRILPYRTTANVIDGLVITFVDVSKLQKLQVQTERLLEALARSSISVYAQNRELKYEWVYGTLYGRQPHETLGKSDRDLVGTEDGERLMAISRKALERGEAMRERVQLRGSNGNAMSYELYVEPLLGEGLGLVGVVSELGGGRRLG
jgi:two-component system, chemotaxis family, CheB/CheR fusion protein